MYLNIDNCFKNGNDNFFVLATKMNGETLVLCNERNNHSCPLYSWNMVNPVKFRTAEEACVVRDCMIRLSEADRDTQIEVVENFHSFDLKYLSINAVWKEMELKVFHVISECKEIKLD